MLYNVYIIYISKFRMKKDMTYARGYICFYYEAYISGWASAPYPRQITRTTQIYYIPKSINNLPNCPC